MKNKWQTIPNNITESSVEYLYNIIDDALTHSFEFKVEDGQIYFREICNCEQNVNN